MKHISRAWTKQCDEVLEGLVVQREHGLDTEEVRERVRRVGPNALRVRKRESTVTIALRQFKNLITGILSGAAIVSFAVGEPVQGTAISIAVIINAAIGFVTELKAVRSMEALRELGRTSARVRRNGEESVIAADELVPGDIVVVAAGDIISADLRILEASRLETNESTLTGESATVAKQVDAIADDTPLAERSSMLWKGTAITRGSGEGVVTATGSDTELGEVSKLVSEVEDEATPIEVRLNRLGRRLLWVALGVGVVVSGAGILAGREVQVMIETSIALAVAAIPEGLPVVATIALALGMQRMARKNALMGRLSAVETLGATDTIFSDKTGTLTENCMTAAVLRTAEGEVDLSGISAEDAELPGLDEAIRIGVLVNNASLAGTDDDEESSRENEDGTGDPVEIALLRAGREFGVERSELLEELPEEREVAFDPEVKMMATVHRREGDYLVAVKGAPEPVIESSVGVLTGSGTAELAEADRSQWNDAADSLAGRGLRVLALAQRSASSAEEDPYRDLVLVGLVGFRDPPLDGAAEAVASLREMGIRVIMVTGDQPATAKYVAEQVGIPTSEDGIIMGRDLESDEWTSEERERKLRNASIFARVTPRQKLDLIQLYQETGSVVGMTGDGINDAPALRKADIGIAMGERGTDVACESADMILQDDRLSTVVAAVREGRTIFENIRRFVVYLLPCHVSEITAVTVAALAGAPLPLRPLQILYLNIVTDVFPALALGVGRGDGDVTRRSPRAKSEAVLTGRHWAGVGIMGGLMGLGVLVSLFVALRFMGFPEQRAVTIAFLTQGFGTLWHVTNVRERGSRFLSNDVTHNPFVWGALALCAGLLLATLHVPLLQRVLGLSDPGRMGWLMILGISLAPWVGIQLYKSLRSAPG